MFAKVSNGAVIKTSDGTTKMQEYGWKTLRELSRPERIADGWYDFVQANMRSPVFGFHSGGTSIVIDASAGTVTEIQNPDIPMSAEDVAKQVKAQAEADIDAMERASMIPRATREFMIGYAEATFTPEQLAANIGYQKVKAFDNQIRALRAQL
jgi:hypothetical protein